MRLESVLISCKTVVVTLKTPYWTNPFTNLRFVVTIQIWNEMVSIMTTKSCTCMCVATFLSNSVRYYVRYLKKTRIV